jgi:pimeloyl-ACP methyl ester carboxylesterase
MRRSVLSFLFASALLPLLSPIGAAQAQKLSDYGVVLMHGKQGAPGGLTAALASALRAAGAAVVTPEMPWSRARSYDAGYEQAMAQIEAEAKKLRAAGKAKIVIAGHSFGANAAMGYAVRHGDIAAVVAMAPGHTPEWRPFSERLGGSIRKAKELLAGGKGDAKESFSDLNQGESLTVTATPKVYLSYFDPQGPASMQANAAAMKPVPLLMAVGQQDPIAGRARAQIFDPAAKNPKSQYLQVRGGHKDTSNVAAGDVVAWLSRL